VSNKREGALAYHIYTYIKHTVEKRVGDEAAGVKKEGLVGDEGVAIDFEV
jgi:hypothetical protein